MFLLAALLAASVLPSTLATPKSEAGGEQGWTELMAHDDLMAHAVTTACAAGLPVPVSTTLAPFIPECSPPFAFPAFNARDE